MPEELQASGNHSPLPWRITEVPARKLVAIGKVSAPMDYNRLVIVDADEEILAEIFTERDFANAKLIVAAVNAFGEAGAASLDLIEPMTLGGVTTAAPAEPEVRYPSIIVKDADPGAHFDANAPEPPPSGDALPIGGA